MCVCVFLRNHHLRYVIILWKFYINRDIFALKCYYCAIRTVITRIMGFISALKDVVLGIYCFEVTDTPIMRNLTREISQFKRCNTTLFSTEKLTSSKLLCWNDNLKFGYRFEESITPLRCNSFVFDSWVVLIKCIFCVTGNLIEILNYPKTRESTIYTFERANAAVDRFNAARNFQCIYNIAFRTYRFRF